MEPFRWRRAFFLGLVSYAASLAGLVFDTFVPVSDIPHHSRVIE